MSGSFTEPVFTIAREIPGDSADTRPVLVVPTRNDDGAARVLPGGLDDAAISAVDAALHAVGATGKAGEAVRVLPAPESGLAVASVLAVGLGMLDEAPGAEAVRTAAGVAGRALEGVAEAVTTLSVLDLPATVQGLHLGAYRFAQFRTAKSAPARASLGAVALVIDGSAADGAEAALERSQLVARAVCLARDLVNTPPSHLYPAEFAERARRAGEAAGLQVEVFDEDYLAAHGYGGIVGVGQGSSRPPRLVRLAHVSGVPGAKKVALVGKGITFDTGGISLKPPAGMEHMTSDMGGAAAVVATVILAGQLGLPVDVTATVPMAENMPSGTAQRPGDVLTQYGGTTVEVLNTDAEGRLILADGIVRACADNPDYLIDTATLTGAQMVALGTRTPGVMGTDAFRDRVAALSRESGENGWAMPFPPELRADLDSRVADLTNVGPTRFGGMLLAGVFLAQFVAEGVQWAHIDVAGPAYNTGAPWGYTGKGGTGVPVRTMLAVLEDIARAG